VRRKFLFIAVVFVLAAFICSAAFAANKELLVVEGSFDKIEDVLITLGLQDRVELIGNTKAAIMRAIDSGDYKSLFINCGSGQTDRPDQDLVNKVRDFVHGGGMLYVTDHAANFLKPWEAEMEFIINYDRGNYSSGNWRTTVVDPALRAKFPADRFNASGDIIIHHSTDNGEPISNPGKASVLLQNAAYGSGVNFVPRQAQAIEFKPAAGGRVVYTTFHNHPLGTIQPGSDSEIGYKNAIIVMEYICGSLGTISEQDALLLRLNALASNIIGSPQGGQFSSLLAGWSFSIPDNVTSSTLTFALYASTNTTPGTGQGNTVFTLTSPSGQIIRAQGDPTSNPVVFHVARQPGLWTISYTPPGNVPANQVTTAMALNGVFGTASQRIEEEKEDDDSIRGCNASGGLFLLTFVMIGAMFRGRK